MHIGEPRADILFIVFDLGDVLVRVRNWLLLVRDGVQPARPQVIVKELELILVLGVVLVDGEGEADTFVVWVAGIRA